MLSTLGYVGALPCSTHKLDSGTGSPLSNVASIAWSGSLSFGEKSSMIIVCNEECLDWYIGLKNHLVDLHVTKEMLHANEILLTTPR